VILDESYDWDSQNNRPSEARSDKNDEVFQYLKAQGIPVQMDSFEQTMHGKFLMIDDAWVVLGSTNWTYSALSKNVEVSVLMQNDELCYELSNFFEMLWNQSEKGQVIQFSEL